ncbi:unnamed protein product [Plutella xylostella]|uniref:(diamondback moth) hypothetical protein n=1 Tax=Plutella xylostella TaxID=51655 RepID=A0A8S4CZM7_PLUXY|nr:unnamed protein product [Plutella xylostella]
MKHNTCINKYERIQSHSRSDYLSYLNRRTKLKPRKDYKILSSRSDLFQDSKVLEILQKDGHKSSQRAKFQFLKLDYWCGDATDELESRLENERHSKPKGWSRYPGREMESSRRLRFMPTSRGPLIQSLIAT